MDSVKIEVSLKQIQERLMDELMRQPRSCSDDEGNEYASECPLIEEIKEKVAESVKERFSEQIEAVVSATIKDAVERQLAEGFSTFNQYGALAERKTLNQLIQEAITTKRRENYGEPERTVVENAILRAVKTALEKDFASEVAAIKEDFSKTVKSKLGDAAAEAIARAAGIR